MLDISAVSVHRALHSLEDAMSCQLFSLQGRNLIPNDAAQVLADRFVGCLARDQDALARAEGSRVRLAQPD